MIDVRQVQRGLVVCVVFLILNGCVYNNEPGPRIVYSPSSVDSDVGIIAAEPAQQKRTYLKRAEPVPWGWVPSASREKNWTAIVIHHSGTESGNAAIFDKWHREGNHWDGVGYDFVVGNGTDSSDGQVEVTFRWHQQRTGAHCGGTPGNWANRDAVGICLVGNFNNTVPTRRQMESLARLVTFLRKRYKIPTSRVYGHNTTPGARITDCPGKLFPMSQLLSMVRSRL